MATSLSSERSYDVIVVGGGIIGAAIAWRTAALGLSVAIIDPDPVSQGASSVAAGMLAPVTEAAFGEDDLLQLNLASSRMMPGFLRDLGEATGDTITTSGDATLFLAMDRDEKEGLLRLHDFQRRLGLETRMLTAEECRHLEPSLDPKLRAGILAAGDTAIDPRPLLASLEKACHSAGVMFHRGLAVTTLLMGFDGCEGVQLEDGSSIGASTVVIAAGCWSGKIDGAGSELSKVRPVKGQLLRLVPAAGESMPIRHILRTEEVYVVPRPHEVVVGATVEEAGFDTSVTAGGMYELLGAAIRVVPSLRYMELKEASAGLRPATPDNAPLIGRTSVKGVIAATGHYRNGILLAPITADAVATILSTGESPSHIAAFNPTRFLV